MSGERRIAFAGIGSRGRTHLEKIYDIRSREYLFRDADDDHLSQPQHLYDTHADSGAYWDEDVSGLNPEVTAIFDPSASSRQKAIDICQNNGDQPEAYESLTEFLAADEYDTVVIASPNHTHLEIAVPLLERDIDIFCEKPLATTLEDHDELIVAADEASSVFYTGFNMRHRPTFVRLKQLIDTGAVGRLGMISAHEVRMPFPPGHYYTQEESGGSLLEKDCHDFDWINSVVDSDPVKVAAFGGQQVLSENTDVNDHATVIVEYENGVKASLELCLYAPFSQTRGRVYHVRGSEGIIRTPEKAGTWDLYTRETHDRFHVTTESGSHGGADLRQMKHFLRVLQGRAEPLASPQDAKKAAAIAIAAERSIVEGRMFEITETYDLVPVSARSA